MKFKDFYFIIVLISLLSLVLADDDDCNPLKSDDCDANPALGKTIDVDFKSKSKYFKELKSKGLEYTDDGLSLTIKERFDNPSIKSNFYIMFGKIEVVMKAAHGKGIISSFYLQSDAQDEIDIELFGSDNYEYQSNFFYQGNTSSFVRGGYHNTPKDPIENYLSYSIDWTKDSLTWYIEDQKVRTVKSDDPQGYPQTPMAIFAGVWAGGDKSNPPGTIEWAGGESSYDDTYTMNIKSIFVTDYSTGDKYEYTDNSGDWKSIKAIDGDINGRISEAQDDASKIETETTSSSSSTSSSTTSTSSSSKTTTTDSDSDDETETDTVDDETTTSKDDEPKTITVTATASESSSTSTKNTPVIVTTTIHPGGEETSETQSDASDSVITTIMTKSTSSSGSSNSGETTVTVSDSEAYSSTTDPTEGMPDNLGSLGENNSASLQPFYIFYLIPLLALFLI